MSGGKKVNTQSGRVSVENDSFAASSSMNNMATCSNSHDDVCVLRLLLAFTSIPLPPKGTEGICPKTAALLHGPPGLWMHLLQGCHLPVDTGKNSIP